MSFTMGQKKLQAFEELLSLIIEHKHFLNSMKHFSPDIPSNEFMRNIDHDILSLFNIHKTILDETSCRDIDIFQKLIYNYYYLLFTYGNHLNIIKELKSFNLYYKKTNTDLQRDLKQAQKQIIKLEQQIQNLQNLNQN